MNHQPTRRETLRYFASTAFGAFALSGCASLSRSPKPSGPPNIIYIMSDDHASHAISAYGSKLNQTPNLDRLAKQGMRFTQCFCTNSLCGPSRATLLTGKYSHMNGYTVNDRKFDGAQQTFPKLLQQAGYQTAMIGKWHLGSTPTGFDFFSYMPGQGRYIDPEFVDMDGQKRVTKGYITDIITDKVINYLDTRDKTKPFCLLYHHKAPHREWTPDAKHANLYDNIDLPEPPTFNDDYANRASPARSTDMTIAKSLTKTDVKADPPPGLTPEQLKQWKYQRFIKDYCRVIASLDDNIGRLLDYLDKTGLADNTIVIYTSDNGFFLGDHGWFDKRFMYEESLHVPFIVRYPGHIKPSSVTNAFALNVDFAPTFLDYADAPIPKDMQGRSLRRVFESNNTPTDWRKSIYYHYYEYPGPHKVQPHYGVRTDRYKLIYYNTVNEWELFDLQTDPHELKSVYNDPAYAAIRSQLESELNRLRTDLKDTAP
ncbi:MAG: sulfatase [Planctomycetota bacterium]|nr:sulfatase [Planctomycetota bacterium]